MSRLEFVTAVACEDIRREDNGKLILIGAFGANIELPRFPAVISLSFLVICEVSKPGPIHSKFRLIVDETTKIEGMASLKPEKLGRLLLRTPPVQFQLEKPSTLVFQVAEAAETGAVNLDDWVTLLRLPAEQPSKAS